MNSHDLRAHFTNSRVYVAGHRGLVGSAILRKLEKVGCSNLILRSHAELDLTKQIEVDTLFEKERPEYVFLAAARVGGIWANNTYPADFIRENILIQTNVIDAAYRFGTKKLLFLGSSCIFPKMSTQPIREEYLMTGPLEPTNEWYAVSKIAGIKMCQAYRRQFGFSAIALMPTNLYGPGDNFDLETSHVLPALIRKFHLAKLAGRGDRDGIAKDEARFGTITEPLRTRLFAAVQRVQPSPSLDVPLPQLVTLWGTGTPRREFLHVDDLAHACLFLMEHYDSGEPINVGVGEDSTIGELAEKVHQIVGFQGQVSFDKSKPDGTPRKLLDVSRIRLLGWRPNISLAEGIKSTYAWYLGATRQ